MTDVTRGIEKSRLDRDLSFVPHQEEAVAAGLCRPQVSGQGGRGLSLWSVSAGSVEGPCSRWRTAGK